MSEELKHGRNCKAYHNTVNLEVNGEDCTCGLCYRKQIAELETKLIKLESRRAFSPCTSCVHVFKPKATNRK